MRSVSEEVVDKIKTHLVLCSRTFYEDHAMCDIMWKNILDQDGPQMIMWCMCSAYLRLQIQTHNRQYLLLLLCNSECKSMPY